ncbi:VanZ family protein [bacterium]|nr:VanZ family protein [bacterium]
MMKKYWKNVILIIIAIAWMGVIFYFSHQNGNTSSSMSNRVTQTVVRIFIPNFSDLTKQEQTNILKDTSFIIRKLAHYSEYAILGLFLFSAVYVFTKNQKIVFLISGSLGVLYAISDEFHQSFISGRAPMVKDVLIDSIGLLTALFLLGIIWNIKIMEKKRIEV